MSLFNVLDACTKKTAACATVIGQEGIPGDLVNIVHYIYIAIQVVVPVLLIIFGMVQLGMALTSQKEDEIKKAQSGFFKKLIVAAIVFLVFSIVRFVFYFANSDTNNKTIWGCVNSLLNGECGPVVKDNYGDDELPSNSVTNKS